jgi:hypothetical protein
MPFSNFLDKIIIKGLTEQASEVAEEAKQNASWSKTIPDAIGVGKAEKTSTGYKVDVTVDLNKAPHAAAFEYGSGEHGEKGETYEIAPREKSVLAFPWTPEKVPWRSHKFAGIGRDNKFLFFWVDHPGVEARPYLQPAIEKAKPRLKSRAAAWVKRAYLDSTVKVTVISAKK